MRNLIALVSGLLFSLGLGLSGMMSPKKVLGFLDITRNWDPSLGLVMGGALLITFFSFPLILKRKSPFFDQSFSLPALKQITPSLVIGSAMFGIGWGLIGLCPGPAIANLLSGNLQAVLFVVLMVTSMVITDLLMKKMKS
ncbi:YeeE/YedE family protein [Halobacteriovorax sp. GB3]|uniref:DUF6691 family protein n=1 Tax=Halobacteriovorax sp. GB3 TaxID=2719615 RepID=UPI00235DD554|nr:DUF6691 family protein [Halobacteriovorax sp. GB3]MDD0853433.1 YeeE/YedE family protein [Halobacteriovorax sp. GB3]